MKYTRKKAIVFIKNVFYLHNSEKKCNFVISKTYFGNIDWTGKDTKAVNLQEAAELYVQGCGMTADETKQLQNKLRGN